MVAACLPEPRTPQRCSSSFAYRPPTFVIELMLSRLIESVFVEAIDLQKWWIEDHFDAFPLDLWGFGSPPLVRFFHLSHLPVYRKIDHAINTVFLH